MVTAESPVKLTYEDYRNTPEDERYELLDGELVMSRSAENRSPAGRYGSRNADEPVCEGK